LTHTGYDPTTFSRAVIDVHGNYRDRRLVHEQPDEWISDAVTPRILRPHLVRAGLFLVIYSVVATISVVAWFFVAFAAIAAEASRPGSGSGDAFGGFTLLLLILQILVVVAWIVSLFLPLREPIAEYGLLVEGRGGAAPSAYAWVAQTIGVRRTPFQVNAGKVQNVPVLLLTSGRVRAMVVVSAIGTDLYLGWTMWRSRSTAVLIGNMIRDMVQGLGFRELNSDVRAASTRALRELVHSVIREGVQASLLEPPIDEAVAQANFNQLPALDVPGGTPTAPAPRMPAPQMPAPQMPAPQMPGYPAPGYQAAGYQPPAQPTMGYPAGYPSGYPASYPAAPTSAPTGMFPAASTSAPPAASAPPYPGNGYPQPGQS